MFKLNSKVYFYAFYSAVPLAGKVKLAVSIPSSFSLAVVVPPEPKNYDFSQGPAQRMDKPLSASFKVGTTRVSNPVGYSYSRPWSTETL